VRVRDLPIGSCSSRHPQWWPQRIVGSAVVVGAFRSGRNACSDRVHDSPLPCFGARQDRALGPKCPPFSCRTRRRPPLFPPTSPLIYMRRNLWNRAVKTYRRHLHAPQLPFASRGVSSSLWGRTIMLRDAQNEHHQLTTGWGVRLPPEYVEDRYGHHRQCASRCVLRRIA